MHWQLVTVSLILLGFAAVSRRIDGTPITAPMLFTAAGLVVGVEALGLFDPAASGESVKLLAEGTLTVVLFSDASRIDLGALRSALGIPTRLLGIGLPLTIVAGVLAGIALLGELTWAEALVLAIVLAPTDAALGQTVVTSPRVHQVFPSIRPRGFREALERARANEDRELAETRWSDARSSLGAAAPWGGAVSGSRLVDSRALAVAATSRVSFAAITRIGGDVGWYYANWLWRLRGALDLVVGGAGMRRSRRDPDVLFPGDPLDFWRVEAVERDRLVRLRAEMKVPGRAWLQFEVLAEGDRSVIRQTALFEPRGLAGLAYWYALYPLHSLIFAGMLRGIAAAAER